MPRRRLYQSAAEKQAAYRARLAREMVMVDRGVLERMNRRLEELHGAVYRASGRGDDFARQCIATSVDTMLERMRAAFEARATLAADASGGSSPPTTADVRTKTGPKV